MPAEPSPSSTGDDTADEKLDDDHYPAYSMGRAAEILDVTQAFLRALGAAELLAPRRSAGGHRRYSRHQLRRAARARELMTTNHVVPTGPWNTVDQAVVGLLLHHLDHTPH